MFPGLNPRKMQQMMKQLGIQSVEIPATEVIIKTPDKNLVIENPQVSKVNMMGQETFQIVGEIREEKEPTAPEISEEDIQTVREQTGAEEKTARRALEETQGDLAEAILKLKKQ